MPRTWFITGASRGLGAEMAKAVLEAGDQVVAAVRHVDAASEALRKHNPRLLPVALDVTDPEAARRAVDDALCEFESIDVLVNNAGYGQYGFFEESTLKNARDQIATNVLGVLNVTWEVLPAMRQKRQGRIFNLSSLGGLVGGQLASLYCMTKFALEGFSESLALEVAPFGIHVTIVEPGPFRTDFLTSRSLRISEKRVADYDDRRAFLRAAVEERNGKQPGDPARLARAIIALADMSEPPLRFLAGAFAVGAVDEKLASMRAEFDRWRQSSIDTDGSYEDSASLGGMTSQFNRSRSTQPARPK
jgi:NAD(P)-dependent dehydrogenase (short-subunit alcohol dehydrogenase family)